MSIHNIRLPLTILAEVCQASGYRYELVDQFTEALVKISDGQRHFFAGMSKLGMYPLNSHHSVALANDKAWTYQVLHQAGFQIPPGDYFFLTPDWKEYRPEGKELVDALAYANKIGFPVFVKPNDGSSGFLAEIISDQPALEKHLTDIARISQIALVQKPIQQAEYRLFVVDDEVQFAYRRQRPFITGDGQHTIGELVTAHNTQIPLAKHRIDPATDFLREKLRAQKLSMTSVVPEGEKIEIAAHANLAGGGQLTEYQEILPVWVHEWASKVIKTVGLRVAGIDVFMPKSLVDSSVEETQNWTIIEVNSNPNLAGIYTNGHAKTAQKTWIKILHKYFKKD